MSQEENVKNPSEGEISAPVEETAAPAEETPAAKTPVEEAAAPATEAVATANGAPAPETSDNADGEGGKPGKSKKEIVVNYLLSKERLSRLLPTCLMLFGFCFMLFIAGPYEIYCNNIEEFLVKISDFIGYLVLYFFVCFIGATAILFLLPKVVYKPLYCFLFGFFLMMFVQSNYLSFGLHSLAGDNIENSLSVGFVALDIIVWVLVIAAVFLCVYLIRKRGNIVRIVCIIISAALIATQLATVVSSAVNSADVDGEKDNITALSTKDMTALGDTNNVFLFCIDRFDGEYCEEVIQKRPEIFKELDGFTYYRDNVAMYGHTYPALVNMLTMKRNVTDDGKNTVTTRDDFIEQSYKDNGTLKVLADNGYQVNIYTDQFYGYSNFRPMPEYVANANSGNATVKIKQPEKVAGLFTLIQLCRCAPVSLSAGITELSSHSVNMLTDIRFPGSEEHGAYTTDMRDIYRFLESTPFVVKESSKMFTMVHFTGCHSARYDEDWSVNHDISSNMTVSVKNSFAIIDFYLRALKDNGLYKDATIIITGDHSSPHDESKGIQEPRITSLFFKPAGEDAKYGSTVPYKTSNKQTSHDNIWASIFKSEGIAVEGDYGKAIQDIGENEVTVRTNFWDYAYYYSDWKQAVYEIKGPAWDLKSWREVETRTFKKDLYA